MLGWPQREPLAYEILLLLKLTRISQDPICHVTVSDLAPMELYLKCSVFASAEIKKTPRQSRNMNGTTSVTRWLLEKKKKERKNLK